MKHIYKNSLSILIVLIVVQFSNAQSKLTAQQELEKSFFHGARTSDLTLLKEFIKTGVDINYQGENGYTGLMIAAYSGQKKAVEFFISNGADPCVKDKRGNTALMGAIVAAEDDIATLLIANQDCKDQTIQRTIEYATRFNRKKVLALLKKNQ